MGFFRTTIAILGANWQMESPVIGYWKDGWTGLVVCKHKVSSLRKRWLVVSKVAFIVRIVEDSGFSIDVEQLNLESERAFSEQPCWILAYIGHKWGKRVRGLDIVSDE